MDDNMTDEFDASIEAATNALITHDDVVEMIKGYGASIDVHGLSLDEEGRCLLPNAEGREILLLYAPPFPGITLFTSMVDAGKVPDEILIGLLVSNASWTKTSGGTFSIAQPEGTVLFSRRVVIVEPTPNALTQALAEFGLLAERWETEIYFHLDAIGEKRPDPTPATPMTAV
ncbi:MAG: type III secretion system chaperone [Pseudomonadota bacterium]